MKIMSNYERSVVVLFPLIWVWVIFHHHPMGVAGVARAGHSMMSCVKSHESTSLFLLSAKEVSKLCKENVVFIIHLLTGGKLAYTHCLIYTEKISPHSPTHTMILPFQNFPLSPAFIS